MKKAYSAFAVVAVLVVLTIVLRAKLPPTAQPNTYGPLGPAVNVTLVPQGTDGQLIQGMISAGADAKVTVALNLLGAAAVTPEPAHIHRGSCEKPGEVLYALSDVIGGASVTTLNVSWDDLVANVLAEPLIINVHRSAAQAQTYLSCGQIPAIAPTRPEFKPPFQQR